jgi:hypothetical protein
MSAATGARWVGWGRSTWHVQPDDSGTTVCGRAVPDDARTTIYNPVACRRCKAKAPELVEAAEAERKGRYEIVHGLRAEALDANRAGKFVVHRCRLCGRQHSQPNPGVPGVPYCWDENHVADLEIIWATGPAWVSPEPARKAA